ncbi:hypothetical protein BJ875DRAFT_446939 [Amylocarpus encephaloides]|uniref:Uncharacterized protein n=1 Tax=Amylocarpus encephaloides TaxID=45428 RepID=A0A9P7Y6C4_9HELO|nr:hypothetical protein BJ875DRAFT_446939 [Amylocarpus encephaloides]
MTPLCRNERVPGGNFETHRREGYTLLVGRDRTLLEHANTRQGREKYSPIILGAPAPVTSFASICEAFLVLLHRQTTLEEASRFSRRENARVTTNVVLLVRIGTLTIVILVLVPVATRVIHVAGLRTL